VSWYMFNFVAIIMESISRVNEKTIVWPVKAIIIPSLVPFDTPHVMFSAINMHTHVAESHSVYADICSRDTYLASTCKVLALNIWIRQLEMSIPLSTSSRSHDYYINAYTDMTTHVLNRWAP
jgi:hypothetical protein